MERVEGFFQSFDMFSAPATLRARGSSSVTRTSAGVISFIFFCYFLYIFIIGMIHIFTFESITSSETFQKIPLTQIYASNFMFGIGNLRLEPELLASFSIKASIVTNKKGVIENVTMDQCKPSQWQKLGEDYVNQFSLHYLDRFLCPSQPEKLKLINSTLLEDAVFFQILIQPTNPAASDFNYKKIQELQEQETYKFNLFFLDQAVIPNEEQGVQFFVNIDHFAYFSPLKRHKTLIRLSNFQISTDYSILPLINDYEIKKGQRINDAVLADVDSTPEASNSKITFSLTNDMYIYRRRVGKIDEMFSYAGGLFALVIWCLAFFVGPFNQYRYELMVAESTFNFDSDGNKVLEKDFNFLMYIKYSLYGWIEKYFCVKPNWKDCRKIEETIAEANDQMDVMRLFRKLQFLEMALIHSTNQNQNFIIALTEPRSLSEVREERLILEYYFFVIKGEPAATVQDAINGAAKRFQNLMEPGVKYSDNESMKQIKFDEVSNQQKMLDHRPEIKEKLIEYLNLGECEDICEAIAAYPAALDQSRKITLSHELQQIEERLTRYFLKMELNAKVKIMKRIPLKIIHRLCLRSEQMSNRDTSEEQLKTEK